MLPCISGVLPLELFFSELGCLPLVPRNTPGYPGNEEVIRVKYATDRTGNHAEKDFRKKGKKECGYESYRTVNWEESKAVLGRSFTYIVYIPTGAALSTVYL
jgi:hypothetical protein